MKAIKLLAMAIMLVSTSALASDNGEQTGNTMPPGVKGSYETLEATVLKVFAADDNEARFRAYLVRWREFDVVVSDPLGTTDKKEGELITFMVQVIDLGKDDMVKTLNFTAMDFGAYRK